jgi:hypothetical protein
MTDMKYELQYRDGANYKFNVTVSVPKKMEVGQEITMEELGYTQEQFFEEHIHYKIDPEVDHNILEVVEVLADDEETDITM